MEACFIGLELKTPCHKKKFGKIRQGFMLLSDLSEMDKFLLKNRTGINVEPDRKICFFHKGEFLTKLYDNHQRLCCDAFGKHQSYYRRGVSVITFQKQQDALNKLGITLICGKKLCNPCNSFLLKQIAEKRESHLDIFTDNVPSSSGGKLQIPSSTQGQELRDIKKESTPSDDEESTDSSGEDSQKAYEEKHLTRPQYVRKTLLEIQREVQQVTQSASGLQLTQLLSEKEPEHVIIPVRKLKEKIQNLSRDEIRKVLTLLPEDNWPISSVQNVFGVSRHLAEKARKDRQANGIFPSLSERLGTQQLSEETVTLVVKFYEEPDISRISPGMKDASVKYRDGREIKQKRLLLFNLKDIFSMFKTSNPNCNISFSEFCSLRPKWCLTDNAPGMHNVCFCSYHQNVKLMILAIPNNKDIDHHVLMNKAMCEVKTELCHDIKCDDCPGREGLRTFLKNHFDTNQIDEDDSILFNEWRSDGRTKIRQTSVSMEEFVDILSDRCLELIPHSNIAKCQSKHLKTLKENLTRNQCLIILDFAQNYSFMMQDEQGFQWNNTQCTLHPICVYFKDACNEIKCHDICVLSDCWQHDASTVYSFLHAVLPSIKCRFSGLETIYYFSDDCAGQYKNKFNLMNLCHHEEDFGIKAEWHFFATSHGKGPCEAVGGTVKRLAARASLQEENQHILTSEDLYNWCSVHVKNIQFFHVKNEQVEEISRKIDSRLSTATALKGTRGFHAFIPVSLSSLKCARTSNSSDWYLKHFTRTQAEDSPEIALIPGSYVACYHLTKWWIGMVSDLSEEEGECSLLLLHPHGPSNSFSWPRKVVTTVLPIQHILCKVDLMTPAGNLYYINDDDKARVLDSFSNLTLTV